LLFWLVRRRLIQRVAEQMMVRSAEQRDEIIDELKADEVDSGTTPQWSVHEADTSTPETIAPRLRHEQAALQLLRRLCLADMGFGVAYSLLSMLSGIPAADHWVASVGSAIGLALVAIAAVRYVLFRRQFRAYDLARSRARQRLYDWLSRVGVWILNLVSIGTGASVSNLVYVPAALRTVFGLRVRLAVAAGLIVFATGTAIEGIIEDQVAAGVGMLTAAALHGWGSFVLARRLRQIPGIQLLVLRVFNIDETSSFTFSGLMSYWRHFGNHYTVVDTAFLRQRYEASSTGTALKWFVGWGALGLASALLISGLEKLLNTTLSWQSMIPIVVLLALGGAWLLLRVGD
jgi:hypothetical protein